jgi:hypothetical protein
MKKQESSKKFNNGNNINNMVNNKKTFLRSGSLHESATSAFRMFEQIRNDKSVSPDKQRPRQSIQVNSSLFDLSSKQSSNNTTTVVEKGSPKKEPTHRPSISSPVVTLSSLSGKATITPTNSTYQRNSIFGPNGINALNNFKSPEHAKLSHDKKMLLDSYAQKKSITRGSISVNTGIINDPSSIDKRRESNSNITPFNTSTNLDTSLSSQIQASIGASKSSNIKVNVRFRPLNTVEKDFISSNIGFITCEFPQEEGSVVIKTDPTSNSSSTTMHYRYDKVFQLDTSQQEIYNSIGKETLLDVCNGYNGTIFTYGQSGSGKTFTMYGSDIYDDESKGLIPRCIDHLFKVVEESGEDSVFQLKFSIMQIYKEIVYDLLTGEKDLKVKESPTKGIYVEGLSEFYIDNTESFLELLQMSQEQRVVSGTKLNQHSSRSHTIFVLEVTQTLTKHNITKRGILNLVDLAGTEKVSKTGAVGETLEEAKKINLSLSALGNVIHSLTNGSDHIPYRDSKLTRILQESLGGNYKTTLIVACSPHSYHLEETISSLKFAQRAKTIKNKIKMNVKLSYEELQKIITNLRTELELANKEIFCLKDILKGSNNMGENIVTLLEAQNVKNCIQSEIVSSELKLLEIRSDDKAVTVNTLPDSGNGSNINIVNNNSASSVNIYLPGSAAARQADGVFSGKLSLVKRRSSFIDSNVRNNLKNLLGDKFKGIDGDFSSSSSSESSSDSESSNSSSESKSGNKSKSSKSSKFSKSSHSKSSKLSDESIHIKINSRSKTCKSESDSENNSDHSEISNHKNRKKKKKSHISLPKKKNKHDNKKISHLEEKLKKLEADNKMKDLLIKENNKDLLTSCRELYEKLSKDLRICPPREKDTNSLNYNRYGSLLFNLEVMNSQRGEENNSIIKDFQNGYREKSDKENPVEISNLDISSLTEKVSSTLSAFDKIIKVFSENLDVDNKRILNNTFNLEKLKSALNNNNLDSDVKILSSLLPDEKDLKQNIFNTNFMKNLQYKLNMELVETYNLNLTNQNKILNSQNEILLTILSDMMSLNQKLLSRVDSTEKSVHDISMSKTENRRGSLKPITMPFGQNKIAKFVTRKNVEMFKTSVSRRASMDYNMLVSLRQFQNNTGNSTVLQENSRLTTYNENEENQSMSDTKSFYNPMAGNNPMHKSLEKCNEQLNTLKEFILKSFKEAQKMKSTFDTILSDLKMIGLVSEEVKPGKIHFPFLSLKLNDVEKKAALREELDDARNIIKSLQTSPGRKPKKLINSKLSKLEEIDEEEEFKLSPTSKKMKELRDIKTSPVPELKGLRSRSPMFGERSPDSKDDLDKNSTFLIVSQSKNTIERMFKKYSSTGSASK